MREGVAEEPRIPKSASSLRTPEHGHWALDIALFAEYEYDKKKLFDFHFY
jgi:hypothetical protein